MDVLLDQDLDSQGPFDLVIQKLTDELVASQRGDAAAKRRIESFVVFHSSRHCVDFHRNGQAVSLKCEFSILSHVFIP